MGQYVHRKWENNCGIFLRGDGIQRLQVAQLQKMDEYFSVNVRTSRLRNQSTTWRAAGEDEMISDASFKARDAFCSPSAAMTLARASRAASASAAMARCIWTGKRTSLLYRWQAHQWFYYKQVNLIHLHFNTLHFDAPRISSFIQTHLHSVRDVFTIC